MKQLIVNADDLGASHGTNRGIVDAHVRGIVTSASLLVDAPASAEAASLARRASGLSVGLHLDLDGVLVDHVPAECERQWRRFRTLCGVAPTHVDTHHNTHRDPRMLRQVLAFARAKGLPLRGHSTVRVCSKFYGQWGGETHVEQISVAQLAQLLLEETRDGVTELTCHPGYMDPNLRSSYASEREAEVRTLCDPRVRTVLDSQSIRLISFRDLPDLVAGAATRS
jgi:predicted glycoside hydrolase/deacetylase ChbG (UPF0249 family)